MSLPPAGGSTLLVCPLKSECCWGGNGLQTKTQQLRSQGEAHGQNIGKEQLRLFSKGSEGLNAKSCVV